MPDIVTVDELFGLKDETEAENFAKTFRRRGHTVAVVQESDGTWMLRIFPKGYGDVKPASNPGVETTGFSPGAPVTPGEGGVKVLLDYIARFESGGNYNAYFRHAENQDNPRLTAMTLNEVIAWQEKQVRSGAASTAAGRYQIIKGTLKGLINSMKLDASSTKFDEATQDRMAIKLLEEKGLMECRNRSIAAEDFANAVTRCWAALPIVTDDFMDSKKRIGRKGLSYYADDGLNKSHTGVDSYLRAIKTAIV